MCNRLSAMGDLTNGNSSSIRMQRDKDIDWWIRTCESRDRVNDPICYNLYNDESQRGSQSRYGQTSKKKKGEWKAMHRECNIQDLTRIHGKRRHVQRAKKDVKGKEKLRSRSGLLQKHPMISSTTRMPSFVIARRAIRNPNLTCQYPSRYRKKKTF